MTISGKAAVIAALLVTSGCAADVVLCLDHDEPGQTAAKRIQEELQEAGYHSGILLPVCKIPAHDGLGQGYCGQSRACGS